MSCGTSRRLWIHAGLCECAVAIPSCDDRGSWLTVGKGTLARSLIANRDGISNLWQYQMAGGALDEANRWGTLLAGDIRLKTA